MREWRDILGLFATSRGPMALATVVATRGSSYRAAGARMLICRGQRAGSLSGGCLEDDIVELARGVVETGLPAFTSIDTRLLFGCSGSVDVFVERVDRENAFLQAVARAWSMREPLRGVTPFNPEPGAKTVVVDKAYVGGEDELLDTILPPIRLFVVGGGRDGEALMQLGDLLGWEVRDFDRVERAQDVPAPDSRTAAIIKTRNFGRDLVALQALLPLPFGYVGLLGAARRRDQILNTLADEGFVEAVAAFPRLHAPAGLDLGAETPHEIALAIVSEIQAVISGHDAGFLKEKTGPIHKAHAGGTECLNSRP